MASEKREALDDHPHRLDFWDALKQRVVLNRADCSEGFIIKKGNGLQGSAAFKQLNFVANCWPGARANVGITGGKYCFGCKILPSQTTLVDSYAKEEYNDNLCRLGISRGGDYEALANLGKSAYSFGYGDTGRFTCGGMLLDYGDKFEPNDTIVCAVNLEDKAVASIGFSKNGNWLGIAVRFNARTALSGHPQGPGSAFFPHVLLLNNVVVEMQFSVEGGLVAVEGFKPWDCALDDGNAVMGFLHRLSPPAYGENSCRGTFNMEECLAERALRDPEYREHVRKLKEAARMLHSSPFRWLDIWNMRGMAVGQERFEKMKNGLIRRAIAKGLPTTGLEERLVKQYTSKSPVAGELREKDPDFVPVILEKDARSNICDSDMKMILVHREMPVGEFVYHVRRNLELVGLRLGEPIFVSFKNTKPPADALMASVDEENKDEDGFLRVTYSGEGNASGFINHEEEWRKRLKPRIKEELYAYMQI